MSTLTQRLRAKLAFDESAERLRCYHDFGSNDNIYHRSGAKFEHARLRPILEQLCVVVAAASLDYQMLTPELDDALTALEKMLEER